jgi:hypothetical protein
MSRAEITTECECDEKTSSVIHLAESKKSHLDMGVLCVVELRYSNTKRVLGSSAAAMVLAGGSDAAVGPRIGDRTVRRNDLAADAGTARGGDGAEGASGAARRDAGAGARCSPPADPRTRLQRGAVRSRGKAAPRGRRGVRRQARMGAIPASMIASVAPDGKTLLAGDDAGALHIMDWSPPEGHTE